MSANSRFSSKPSRLNCSGLNVSNPTHHRNSSLLGFQMPRTVDRNRFDVFETALGISCNFLEKS
jgi:hypothetical protein